MLVDKELLPELVSLNLLLASETVPVTVELVLDAPIFVSPCET